MLYIRLQMLVQPRRIPVAHAIPVDVRAYDPHDDPHIFRSAHRISVRFRLPLIRWTLAVLPSALLHVHSAYIARCHATYARIPSARTLPRAYLR